MIARQSTARDFIIGPVLDSSGVAVTTAVVGDFKVSKNGAAPAALNGSTTLTHRHTGFYSINSASGDFDTVGLAQFTLDKGTDTCGMVCFNIIEEAVFDAFYASGAVGYISNAPVNVTQFGGSNGTFNSGRPEVNTTHAAGTAWGSGAITASALASDAANEIADAILVRSVSNVEGSAGEHTLCTVILACLEYSVSGTTWTIKRTDGTTTHATKTLTTNGSAEHITGVT